MRVEYFCKHGLPPRGNFDQRFRWNMILCGHEVAHDGVHVPSVDHGLDNGGFRIQVHRPAIARHAAHVEQARNDLRRVPVNIQRPRVRVPEAVLHLRKHPAESRRPLFL